MRVDTRAWKDAGSGTSRATRSSASPKGDRASLRLCRPLSGSLEERVRTSVRRFMGGHENDGVGESYADLSPSNSDALLLANRVT